METQGGIVALYPVQDIANLYPEDPQAAAELFKTQAYDPEKIEHLVLTYGDPNVAPDATREALLTMLRHIPPDKQKRVLDRIDMETKPRGFTASHMQWWDIQPQWRILCFVLHRDQWDIPVTLMWKMTNPAASSLFTPSRCWIPDRRSHIGFGMEFHYEAYQHLRASFIEWLNKPLELPCPFPQSA